MLIGWDVFILFFSPYFLRKVNRKPFSNWISNIQSIAYYYRK